MKKSLEIELLELCLGNWLLKKWAPLVLQTNDPLGELLCVVVVAQSWEMGQCSRKSQERETTVLLCLCHKPLGDNCLWVYFLICKMERLTCQDPSAHDMRIICGCWKDDSVPDQLDPGCSQLPWERLSQYYFFLLPLVRSWEREWMAPLGPTLTQRTIVSDTCTVCSLCCTPEIL